MPMDRQPSNPFTDKPDSFFSYSFIIAFKQS